MSKKKKKLFIMKVELKLNEKKKGSVDREILIRKHRGFICHMRRYIVTGRFLVSR